MRFCEYRTLRRVAKGSVDLESFYRESIRIALRVDRELAGQLQCEYHFHDARCPYYAVHRSIADGLSNVPLDVDCSLLKLPLETLEIRFPEPGWYGIRSILACEIDTQSGPGWGIWVDAGETDQHGGPVALYQKFPRRDGQTVAAIIDDMPWHTSLTQAERAVLRSAVQLTLAVCLIGQDDELVKPDVLTADADKLTPENAEKLAAKARQRGKIGWIVGDASNTMSPHYRREHFAIRWVGKGRTMPKLTRVKATTVHRDQVKNVPTGYEDGPT